MVVLSPYIQKRNQSLSSDAVPVLRPDKPKPAIAPVALDFGIYRNCINLHHTMNRIYIPYNTDPCWIIQPLENSGCTLPEMGGA